MSRLAPLAVLALVAGCARDNPLYAVDETGSGSSSNSSTSSADVTSGSTDASASVGASSGGLDSTGTSESSDTSTSSTSTGGEEFGCPYELDDDAVAYYRFEEPLQPWIDEVGEHDGQLASGLAGSVPGPRGCGNALGVDVGLAGRVDDSPAFDLAVGSIDLWVLPPATEEIVPLLSRDALGAETEHVTFFLSRVASPSKLSSSRHLIIRHQSMGTAAAVCSEEPLDPGVWVHVAYNFGPPGMELYIDGILQESTEQPTVPGGGIPACDGLTNDPKLVADPPPFVGGLETEMPWFIGASAQSEPKMNQIPAEFMGGGRWTRSGSARPAGTSASSESVPTAGRQHVGPRPSAGCSSCSSPTRRTATARGWSRCIRCWSASSIDQPLPLALFMTQPTCAFQM